MPELPPDRRTFTNHREINKMKTSLRTLTIVVGAVMVSALAHAGNPSVVDPGAPGDPTACPRVDIVALSSRISAVRVNGYTLGHARDLQLRQPGGDFTRVGAAGAAHDIVVLDPAAPDVGCKHVDLSPFVIGKETGQMVVNQDVIAKFDAFILTKQNQAFAKKTGLIVLPRGGQLGVKGNDGIIVFGDEKYKTPGTIGGGTGGEIPGGPPLNPPRPICPVGKRCAEEAVHPTGEAAIKKD